MSAQRSDRMRAIQEFVDELVSALMNARVYFAAHPRVQLSIENLTAAAARLTAAGPGGALRLAVAGGYVLFENRPVVGASLGAGRLVEILARLGSGGIEVTAQCDVAGIRALVEALTARTLEPGSYPKVNAALQAQVGDSVRLLPPFRAGVGQGGGGGGSGGDGGVGIALEGAEQLGVDHARNRMITLPTRVYQSVLGMLQDTIVTASQGGTIPMGSVHAEAEKLLQELDQSSGPIMSLASQHEYDAFTLGHSMRVTVLAMDFARGLGAGHDLMMSIGVAGLLHDVGKAMVPFEILHSRRALTDEEREVVNTHPEQGARILLDHDKVDPLAVAAAFGHHRRFDGEGYPRTKHEHISSVATRIVKICDVYEALTAVRPYKAAMSPPRAYRIMISMRGHFDPRLLHKFIYRNGIYANGSTVRLSNGERACVIEQSGDVLRPRVLVTADRDGNELPAKERPVRDLSVRLHGITVAAIESDAPAPPPEETPPATDTVVEGCCGQVIATKPSESR